MKKPKLPKTDSIQKLAEFWDSHDLTDFEGDLTEVTEPVFVRGRKAPSKRNLVTKQTPRKTAINVPFKTLEAQAIQRMALSKGISPPQLVRTWVLQKIAGRSNGRSKKAR